MSAQVSYKKQTLFGIMLLLTLFLAIEIFAQVYDHFFLTDCKFTNSDAVKDLDISLLKQICNDHNSVEYHNNEIHTQIVPNQHFSTVNINEYGFRGQEFSKMKLDNTFRIFLLGGSTAYGSGSTSDKTTITGYLQQMYDEQNLPFNVEIINAGIPAVTSYTEHWLVKNKLIQFEPDLLIIYDGWNDAGKHLDNPGITNTEYLKIMNNKSSLQEKNNSESNNFFEDALRQTKTWNLIRVLLPTYLYQLGIYDVSIVDNTPIDHKVSVWKERWREICKIGKNQGFDVLITIQPILGSGNYTMNEFSKMNYIHNNQEFKVNQLAHYANALDDLPSCTDTKDLRNILDTVDRPIFLDAGHLNDYGNKIVANSLFEISFPIVMPK